MPLQKPHAKCCANLVWGYGKLIPTFGVYMADNIRRLPSGSFQVRMLKEGKQHSKSFTSQKDAKEYLASVITGIKSKTLNTTSKIPTFEDLWDTYKSGDYWDKKKPTTKKRELQVIGVILEKIGQLKIDKIKRSTIALYKLERSKETYLKKKVPTHYSGTQIRLEMCLISAVFSYIIKELGDIYDEWIEVNPCIGVKKPDTSSRIVRVDNTEYIKLLAYFNGRNDRTSIFLGHMLQIAYYTGMRVSEIGRMQWNDIIYNYGTWGDGTPKHIILIPTSKNEEPRPIPIYAELKKVLDNVWEFKKYKDLAPEESRYIFWTLTKKGEYRPYEPAPHLYKLKTQLGITSGLSFHHFRHEFISQEFERGELDPLTISRKTGHKNLQVLNKYAHLNPNLIK